MAAFMKFWQAMKALDEGKKVRCIKWEKGSYIYTTKNSFAYRNGAPITISLYFFDEWEIYEDPENTYTFMGILPGLKEGKKYKRKDNKYYVSASGSKIFYYIDTTLGIRYFPIIDDFEANDWVEVK